MIEPGDIDIQAYEINLKKWGICPYMSVGMSQIPCTDKCALYIVREDDYGKTLFSGCSHKLQAQATDEIRFYKQEEYTKDD